ncbi:hypothetical protein [Natronorubrum sp. FCH18a]|uniref:hypothetical protein n=1 Tax=Natronorubrum sp. FCH18a TaxID=3447018 RepID=UPI003F515D23
MDYQYDYPNHLDEPTPIASSGRELPDPPAYDFPYEPGDAGYDNAVLSGHYGPMYAGEYAWSNVRCTAEAYGETDRDGSGTGWDHVVNGKPRRSLKFHTEWMALEETVACVREIGDYNRFTDDRVIDVLESCPDNTRFVVGRESSPTMYFWTDRPIDVMDLLTIALPDELDAHPDADSYPTLFMGERLRDLENNGEAVLIRAWWD